MAWGTVENGAKECTGCKEVGSGIRHPNYEAMMAANNVNTNFSYADGQATTASGKPLSKGSYLS